MRYILFISRWLLLAREHVEVSITDFDEFTQIFEKIFQTYFFLSAVVHVKEM